MHRNFRRYSVGCAMAACLQLILGLGISLMVTTLWYLPNQEHVISAKCTILDCAQEEVNMHLRYFLLLNEKQYVQEITEEGNCTRYPESSKIYCGYDDRDIAFTLGMNYYGYIGEFILIIFSICFITLMCCCSSCLCAAKLNEAVSTRSTFIPLSFESRKQ